MLAKLRSNTSNPAHAQAFKLASNSLFGKLLQNPIKYSKRTDFFLSDINCDEDFVKMTKLIQGSSDCKINSRYIFKDIKILEKDFF